MLFQASSEKQNDLHFLNVFQVVMGAIVVKESMSYRFYKKQKTRGPLYDLGYPRRTYPRDKFA